MGLKYIGTHFLPGIPARDLTDEEVKAFGEKFLLSTGLYEKPSSSEEKAEKAIHSNKAQSGGSENK